jgi:hypothetical protein
MVVKMKQLEFENDTWMRTLEFIQSESAYAKNILAEVIRSNTGNPEFLDEAEFYQNHYIQQDTLVSLLKNDLRSFKKLLDRERFEDGNIIKHVQGTRRRLKDEIEKLEYQFNDTKKRFGDFLDANT